MGKITDQNRDLIYSNFIGSTFDDKSVDVQDTRLWDTVTLAAGATVSKTTAVWFNNIKNSGKTLAETNMQRDAELAFPEMFSIRSIGLYVDNPVFATDAQNVWRNLAFQLIVGKKALHEAPLEELCQAGGLTFNITTATASNGLATRHSIVNLALPIVIEPNVNFYAQLDGTSQVLTAGGGGGLGLRLRCVLRGMYARGVN